MSESPNGYGSMAVARREHQIESSNSIVSESDPVEILFQFVGGVFRGLTLLESMFKTCCPIPQLFWAPQTWLFKCMVQRQGGQVRFKGRATEVL